MLEIANLIQKHRKNIKKTNYHLERQRDEVYIGQVQFPFSNITDTHYTATSQDDINLHSLRFTNYFLYENEAHFFSKLKKKLRMQKMKRQRFSDLFYIAIIDLSIDYFNNNDQKQKATPNQAKMKLCKLYRPIKIKNKWDWKSKNSLLFLHVLKKSVFLWVVTDSGSFFWNFFLSKKLFFCSWLTYAYFEFVDFQRVTPYFCSLINEAMFNSASGARVFV